MEGIANMHSSIGLTEPPRLPSASFASTSAESAPSPLPTPSGRMRSLPSPPLSSLSEGARPRSHSAASSVTSVRSRRWRDKCVAETSLLDSIPTCVVRSHPISYHVVSIRPIPSHLVSHHHVTFFRTHTLHHTPHTTTPHQASPHNTTPHHVKPHPVKPHHTSPRHHTALPRPVQHCPIPPHHCPALTRKWAYCWQDISEVSSHSLEGRRGEAACAQGGRHMPTTHKQLHHPFL